MEFYGAVGQVAGGNIINYGSDDLSNRTREEVSDLLIHLRERLRDARKKLLINPIVGWMALGFLAIFTELFLGVALSWTLIVSTAFLGVLVPYLLFMPIQSKYGRLIHVYRANIHYIEVFQHSRGWA